MFIILQLCIVKVICAQCDTPNPQAGLFCNPDTTNGAPILCQLECLDGYAATMPTDLFLPQPSPLCMNGNTIPNNMSWFGFVAGSTNVSLTITPTGCTIEFDDNGNPATGIQAGIYAGCDWSAPVVCDVNCGDGDAPITLASGNFLVGVTYFLFVDGCNGSQCDYSVAVNQGAQAFEVPEPTDISCNFGDCDSLCQGATIQLTLDVDLPINYNWTISPTTSDYPMGTHPVNDSNVTNWTFSDEGDFMICANAYNFCDVSTTYCIPIHVERLPDEIFPTIEICQECFGNLDPLTIDIFECLPYEMINPLMEADPNGDGIIGWLGDELIIMPGIFKDTIVNQFGCSYTQSVELIQINLKAREEVDLYFCDSDFPTDYNGVTLQGNVVYDQFPITLNNQASTGCDSLVALNVTTLFIDGSITQGNCDNGTIELSFQMDSIRPANPDQIIYTWSDVNGVISSGPNDMIVGIDGQVYSLSIDVIKDNANCTFDLGSVTADVSLALPQTPSVPSGLMTVCFPDYMQTYTSSHPNSNVVYNWILSPSVMIIQNDGDGTLIVDLSNQDSTEICVSVSNECGVSDTICQEIRIRHPLNLSLDVINEACLDSSFTVTALGDVNDPTLTYNWNFVGIDVISGSISGPGPLTLSLNGNAVPQANINFQVWDEGCLNETSAMVNILLPLDPPMVECMASSNEVIFFWTDLPEAMGYEIVVLSGQIGILYDTSFVVSNLSENELVQIAITTITDYDCGGTVGFFDCMSQNCPAIGIDLTANPSEFCLGENQGNVNFTFVLNGSNGTMGIAEWNGNGIQGNGLFSPELAGTGMHPLILTYEEQACTFRDTIWVEIYEPLAYDIDISSPDCENEFGTIDINQPLLSELAFLTLDGNNQSNPTIDDVTLGNHVLYMENLNGCSHTEMILISPFDGPNLHFTISDTLVMEGESINIVTSVLIPGTSEIVSLEITSNGDVICTGLDCNNLQIAPLLDSEFCVDVVLSDGCNLSDCINVRVLEAINITFPNIFSPNGDGVNDQFVVSTNDPSLLINHLRIYDRWGNLMYNIENVNPSITTIAWNGKYKGSEVGPGVYIYNVSVTNAFGQTITSVSDVTLIR